MSLQNLIKENNYELYCDTMNMENFNVNTVNANDGIFNSVSTSELLANGGTDITIHNNLVPAIATTCQLGNSGSHFSNLWCEHLEGTGTPVKVQNGIVGQDGSHPLYVATNGLMFNNAVPVAPISTYTINFYAEYSGTMTAGNAIPNTIAPYRAVRIGSIVNLSFGFNVTNALVAGNTNPIDITSLPVALRPSSTRVIAIPVNVNNTSPLGAVQINTDGILSIYSNTILSSYYTSGLPAGLRIPDGDLYCISYNLN